MLMTLFLVASIPVTFAFAAAVLYDGGTIGEGILIPAFRGLVVFVPGYIILYLLRYSIELRFNPGRIFFYYSFRDYLILTLIGVVGYYFQSRIGRSSFRLENRLGSLSYYFGFFFFLGIVEAVVYSRAHSIYTLFYLPASRIAIILYAGVVSSLVHRFGGIIPYLLMSSIIVIAAVSGGISLLFFLNYKLIAGGVTLSLLTVSVLLVALIPNR